MLYYYLVVRLNSWETASVAKVTQKVLLFEKTAAGSGNIVLGEEEIYEQLHFVVQ